MKSEMTNGGFYNNFVQMLHRFGKHGGVHDWKKENMYRPYKSIKWLPNPN